MMRLVSFGAFLGFIAYAVRKSMRLLFEHFSRF
jgi:hypothetical protein